MDRRPPDKWTAFLLSLAVPGAGQLFARHWSCLVWFLAAAGLNAPTSDAGPMLAGGKFAVVILLGLASAEHAKRCLEPRSGPCASVRCEKGSGPRVRVRIDLDLPRPAAEIWEMVADFPRFVTTDPFHRRVVLLGPALQPGVRLALEHTAFGVTFWRFGRLLYWREGNGYAFSDLSARGPRSGFPHVFTVTLRPCGTARTQLCVEVRGKWTAGWLPRWATNAWLRFVCREHARLLAALFSEDDR